MRFRRARLCALLLAGWLAAAPFNYFENFSSAVSISNRWDLDFRYGRDGVIQNNGSATVIKVISNMLKITGDPMTGYPPSLAYHTVWAGRCVKLTNYGGASTFSASPENPFGFEIVRTRSRVWHGNNSGWPENMGGLNLWLIEENGMTVTNWNQYGKSLFLYEAAKYIWGTSSRWGIFKGAENRIQMSNLTRPDGGVTNLGFLDFNYASSAVNTTNLGLKMTFDGQTVRFYLNPNPFGQYAFPNEYLLLGETSFPASTNLQIMIGHEANSVFTGEAFDGHYSNFLIRSVTESSASEVMPRILTRGIASPVSVRVRLRTTGDDAGVGQVRVRFPAGWTNLVLRSVRLGGKERGMRSPSETIGKGEVGVTLRTNVADLVFLEDRPNRGGALVESDGELRLDFLVKVEGESAREASVVTTLRCEASARAGCSRWATVGEQRTRPLFEGANDLRIEDPPQVSLAR